MAANKAKKNWAEVLTEKIDGALPQESVKISIVIPVYNCSERINETMQSVSRQHYKDFEVIIIDADLLTILLISFEVLHLLSQGSIL